METANYAGLLASRILEAEVMDSATEAYDYDTMDHSEVNRRFVEDLRATGADLTDVLDIGTGTARIPMELCAHVPQAYIVAVDAAWHMLRVGRQNVAGAGLEKQIELVQVDARRLPYEDGRFATVISNSIVHHIPDPYEVLAEAVRVCRPGGTLFVRDLLRPATQSELEHLVETYAGTANPHQRTMFSDSLYAALSLREIRQLVKRLGYEVETVTATSDRHWTWVARR